MHAVRKVAGVSLAVLGDEKFGSYEVIQAYKPEVICLGYDQHGLAEDLKKQMQKGKLAASILLIKLAAHEPAIFHTSLLTE